MKRKKTFFDEDIAIDESLFDNFDLASIVSWSHLELWCIMHSVEIDYRFFKGVLCGASVISNLHCIILDAIKSTDFLDKFLNEAEVIEMIEKTYSCAYVKFKAQKFWIELALKQDNSSYASFYEDEECAGIKRKFELLDAIFKKNPYSAVRFYDKCKLALHAKDIEYVRWLLKSFSLIANKNDVNAKVFNALQKEIESQKQLSMYMN